MSANTGATVIGPINQADTRDTYPTHYSSKGFGGVRTNYADLAALAGIPAAQREQYMVIFTNDGNAYQLQPDLVSFTPAPLQLALNALNALLVNGAPLILSATPAAAAVGATAVLSGAGFTGTTSVTIDGISAAFEVIGPTSITLTVPNALSGPIGVVTPAGSYTSPFNFTVNLPSPTITSDSTDNVTEGTSFTITGTHLDAVTAVKIGSTGVPFVVDSATQLTVTVTVGTASDVLSLSGNGYTVTGDIINVLQNVPPQVINCLPSTASPGATVTIVGANFLGATAVSFNGTPASSFSATSDGSISAVVPFGTSGPISVTTTRGTGTGTFSFTMGAANPQITAIGPQQGPYNSGLTIDYSGMTGISAVLLNAEGGGTIPVSYYLGNTGNDIEATIPYGAATGPVFVVCDQGTVQSAATFTITWNAPAITSASPGTVAVGSVISVLGTGFYDTSLVKIGTQPCSFVRKSDTQLQVTVPAGAATGAMSITTPGGVATSAGNITVTTDPAVSDMLPNLGPTGTVVSIAGINLGSVTGVTFSGIAATFTLVSASRIDAAVPNGATTGDVVVATPSGDLTVPIQFTVQAPVPSGLSIRCKGGDFIDQNGDVLQLRGVVCPGLEYWVIQGNDPSNPWGGQTGWTETPNWSVIRALGAHVVRIPLNQASWLGYTCYDFSGASRNPDPDSNFKQTVQDAVDGATAAGMYVILDLHWNAPGNFSPEAQQPMADASHSLAFWTSIANTFKGYPNVMFELFNEPYFFWLHQTPYTTYQWPALLAGGQINQYVASDPVTGHYAQPTYSWNSVGTQQMVLAIRNAGATNVILSPGVNYTNDLTEWVTYAPTDSLRQVAATWHPYPNEQYSNAAGQAIAASIKDSGYPVIITEIGDTSDNGSPNSTFLPPFFEWINNYGVSVVFWALASYSPDLHTENVLTQDAENTPTDGYGVVALPWLLEFTDSTGDTRPSLAITTPTGEIDTGTAIALTGTYANAAPTALEYLFSGHTVWLSPATAATIGGGTWSMDVPAGAVPGSTQISVREANYTNASATTDAFTITAGAAGSPEYIGATSEYSVGNAHAIDVPANVIAGDMLLWYVFVGDNDFVWTPPAGWAIASDGTNQAYVPTANNSAVVFYKIASDSEPASYSTADGTYFESSVMYALRNVTSIASIASGSTTGTATPPLTINVAAGNIALLAAGAHDLAITMPAGFTSDVTAGAVGDYQSCDMGYKLIGEAGSITESAGLSANHDNSAILLAVS